MNSLVPQLMLGILLFTVQVVAEEVPGLDRLAEIEARVETETTSLAALQERISVHERDLQVLETELAALRKKEYGLEKELETTLVERDRFSAEVERLKNQFAELSELSIQRLRALYMGKRRVSAQSDMLALRGGSLQKVAYYTTVVKEHDRHMLQQLSLTSKRLREQSNALEGVVKQQDALKKDLIKQRKQIAARVVSARSMVKKIQAEEQKRTQALTGLRAQALRLETVVTSLTEGQARGPEFYTREQPVASTRRVDDAVKFNGSGLDALKGSLVIPVTDARIKKRFGKQRVAGFKDFVFSKGLEFEVPARTAVRAIGPARVMFTGRMPGYGTILILDHGKRSYSLYGQLGDILVQKGQNVATGDMIGRSGQEESDASSHLYFEIRKNGKPVDPVAFYGGKLAL